MNRGTPTTCATALLALVLCGVTNLAAQERSDGVMETSHLIVRYDSELQQDAMLVMSILQKEHDLLGESLGYRPIDRIEAHLFKGTGYFAAEAGSGNERKTVAFVRGILLIRPLRGISEEELYASLSYQMAMIFLAQPLARSCPPWLTEAFALYHSGVSSDCSAETGLASFADLSQEWQLRRSGRQRAEIECLLGKTMQFLIDRYGQERVFSIFRAFDGSVTVDHLFPAVFGESLATTERAWVRAVGRGPEDTGRR